MRRRFRDCGFYQDVTEKFPPLSLPDDSGYKDRTPLPDDSGVINEQKSKEDK